LDQLTPVEVRHEDFGRALRGYEPAKVERFRERVAEELERLLRANQELEARSRNLVEQLRAFRERDKALNDALITAQQLRSEIREQAEREAQLILREARAEGERLQDAARAEVRRLEAELAALERTRRAFIAQMRAIAEKQLQELDAAESAHGSRREEPPPRPEPAAPRVAKKTPAWLDPVNKE
jgi:cell division septum initiation protein DivIVA